MSYIQRYINFILIVCLLGCGTSYKNESSSLIIVDVTSECQHAGLITPRVLLTDVDYIKLRSPEIFFLTEAKKILELDNKLLILDKNKKVVVAYDPEGNYIGQVGKKGLGPDEYQSIFDFDVDTKTNTIVVFSSADQSILIFDNNLNFQKKLKVNTFASQMSILESGNIAFYTYPDRGGENILIYNIDGKFLGKKMDFPKGNFTPMDFTGFISGNHYTYPLSSTIMRIEENKTFDSELYEIKFLNMREDEAKFEHNDFLERKMRENHNILSKFTIGRDTNELLFYYEYNNGVDKGFTLGMRLSSGQTFGHLCLKHGSQSHSDPFVRLFFTGPYNLPIYSKYSDYYYTAATMESMEEVFSADRGVTLNEIGQIDNKLFEILKEAKDNENPIVLKFKLRKEL
jgi:hypothetical protein